jgi:hypothetical protein
MCVETQMCGFGPDQTVSQRGWFFFQMIYYTGGGHVFVGRLARAEDSVLH